VHELATQARGLAEAAAQPAGAHAHQQLQQLVGQLRRELARLACWAEARVVVRQRQVLREAERLLHPPLEHLQAR